MTSLETYVMRIKPAIETFVNEPSQVTLSKVRREIQEFDFGQMRIFQVQILVPLVIKLDELTGENQELRTSLLHCLQHIMSKLYVSDEKGLRSILVVVLQQLRDPKSSEMRANLSEEIKLAAVKCITEALRRSTTDVLEAFYCKATSMIIGQILLTLVELVAEEKYRKLVLAALECLMVVFFVHDNIGGDDVVLRNQVADTVFIFLPKVVIVLFKTAMSDEKVGQAIKATAITALGRIICIMFEKTDEEHIRSVYDVQAFQSLLENSSQNSDERKGIDHVLSRGKSSFNPEIMEQRLKQLQTELRSKQWLDATSLRVRPIFTEISILRSHDAVAIRYAYADMCCLLLKRCAHNLSTNYVNLLESVLALSEDEHQPIAQLCQSTLGMLQNQTGYETIFDESMEMLLDMHLNKFPRILLRCDDNEQFAELLFFKGFLRNIKPSKLELLLLVAKNLDMFIMCLLSALELRITRQLLNKEYSLPCNLNVDAAMQLSWRQFKHVSSKRSIEALYDIGSLLGANPALNRLIFDYTLDLVQQRSSVMNEAILLLILIISLREKDTRESRLILAQLFLEQLLNEDHWHLALRPDASWRLKSDNKFSSWFQDRTPGLYESAVEVRTQDCNDSDDEQGKVTNRVSITDAQFNVLHTCLLLDALGHSAQFIGENFNCYIFRCLHHVLLKLASSNTIVHQAATFAFNAIQMALKYTNTSQFIEGSTDYISYHLNMQLKKSSESNAAIDILTVLLQHSTRGNVPYLDSIFETIHEECSKSYQMENVNSYLRAFHAFLQHVTKWQIHTKAIANVLYMQEETLCTEDYEERDALGYWLALLKRPSILKETSIDIEENQFADVEMDDAENVTIPHHSMEEKSEKEENDLDPGALDSKKVTLPRHIEMIKQIVNQAIRFLSGSDQTQQILALECLSSGVPLLADYEDELLPLVHLIWQPLVEKFRQKDAIVLNRCFTLLHLLGVHAKGFIHKRTLSDVIPQLKEFLRSAATNSSMEHSLAQTQEYKLQLKLLKALPEFIICLQLEGKQLNELLSIVTLYLSQAQPKELQILAIELFIKLKSYNGPFVYVTLMPLTHLHNYKDNVSLITRSMARTPRND